MGDDAVSGKADTEELPDYEVDILIPESEIAARVNALARDINAHYQGTRKLVVVGLLRGSFIFIADLVRRLDLLVEVDFMTVSSYGKAMVSSRDVRILKDLEGDIIGTDVLVVEDIIDTGHTLHQVLEILQTRQPKSLEVCCLLNKPSRREADVKARWIGFDIPDAFVVGYGIDYAQNNRHLPHIGAVRVKG
ncbi:MAG: hypoxanthine phosphoribosyltransferase [Candidatus Puniceispirillales bacterium]